MWFELLLTLSIIFDCTPVALGYNSYHGSNNTSSYTCPEPLALCPDSVVRISNVEWGCNGQGAYYWGSSNHRNSHLCSINDKVTYDVTLTVTDDVKEVNDIYVTMAIQDSSNSMLLASRTAASLCNLVGTSCTTAGTYEFSVTAKLQDLSGTYSKSSGGYSDFCPIFIASFSTKQNSGYNLGAANMECMPWEHQFEYWAEEQQRHFETPREWLIKNGMLLGTVICLFGFAGFIWYQARRIPTIDLSNCVIDPCFLELEHYNYYSSCYYYHTQQQQQRKQLLYQEPVTSPYLGSNNLQTNASQVSMASTHIVNVGSSDQHSRLTVPHSYHHTTQPLADSSPVPPAHPQSSLLPANLFPLAGLSPVPMETTAVRRAAESPLVAQEFTEHLMPVPRAESPRSASELSEPLMAIPQAQRAAQELIETLSPVPPRAAGELAEPLVVAIPRATSPRAAQELIEPLSPVPRATSPPAVEELVEPRTAVSRAVSPRVDQELAEPRTTLPQVAASPRAAQVLAEPMTDTPTSISYRQQAPSDTTIDTSTEVASGNTPSAISSAEKDQPIISQNDEQP